jgi:hypothetical protein
MPENRDRKLCSFFQPIPHDPCWAEIVLFNITGDGFGVPFGLVWLVAVIHIIRGNAIQSHMWSPTVVPDFELVTQLRQMINAFDQGGPFQPFVFQGLNGSFGDRDRAVFAHRAQAVSNFGFGLFQKIGQQESWPE